jgi:hypothetical protein
MMDLTTFEMDKTEARRKFLEYRRAVRERHTAEDAEIMRGYRALAAGKQVIKLSETVREGGLKELRHRNRNSGQETVRLVPNLAVARASAKECWTFGVNADGRLEMRGKREMPESNRRDRIVIGGFDVSDGVQAGWWRPDIRAVVPFIPPPLRPADKLANYHILWEALWAYSRPPIPEDPALLKRIGGDLYAVVAVWDLTPLERAVLSTR